MGGVLRCGVRGVRRGVNQWEVGVQVHGIDTIRSERFSMTCAYCRQRTGATVKCSHNKCHTTFHPLCARKVGCFMVCKHSAGRGRPTYKTWCPQHGEAAQRREQEAATQRAAAADPGEQRAAGGKGTRRDAAAASADAAAPPAVAVPAVEPVEDIAALQKELLEKQDAHVFLKAVRYDMEAARNLAAQVRSPDLSPRTCDVRTARAGVGYLHCPASRLFHRGMLQRVSLTGLSRRGVACAARRGGAASAVKAVKGCPVPCGRVGVVAQVETREKRKVQLADILAQEYDMALSDPVKFAPYHSYLSVGMHQRSVIDWVESTISHKRDALKAKLHSSQEPRGSSGAGRSRHSGGQVPIGAPTMGLANQHYVARQAPPQQQPQPQPSGDYARMQGAMSAGQLAGLPPGGVGHQGVSMHDRPPDFRLSVHGQPGSGGLSASGQLMSPQPQMRQGRSSPGGSRALDDPIMRRHSFEHSMGSPSHSPVGLLDPSGSQQQPGPSPYHGDGMHFASPSGSIPSHRMSLDRGRMSSSGGFPGSAGGGAWMAANSQQRAAGPGPYPMHGSRGSSPGYHPLQRPGSSATPAERGMRSYAMPGGDAPRMMPDPSLQAHMHSGRLGAPRSSAAGVSATAHYPCVPG